MYSRDWSSDVCSSDLAFANLEELCLIPDIVIPPKFKVSDFDKYKGITCPKNHLKMYCRKMGAYSRDENGSFKEYGQRWRDLAAQVAPPTVERECSY